MIQTWAKPEVARCHHGFSDHPLRNVAAGTLALRSPHCLEATLRIWTQDPTFISQVT